MALAVTWGGYADTDVAFSDFFGSNHTVAVRFMLQYPNAYRGPMVGVKGGGTYLLGQGDYTGDAPSGKTKLIARIGTGQITAQLNLAAGAWHHIAIVRQASSIKLYVDGTQQGTSLAVPSSGLPNGKVRLGKTAFTATLDGGGDQFYGLLDDVAIFTSALSASQVQQLAQSAHLSGTEADLLAGYVFGYVPPGGLTPKLSRPLTRKPAAILRSTSANRDNSQDAKLLPLALTSHMRPPIPSGQPWFVIQGFDSAVGSHQGYASFCWDLMLAGKPQKDSEGARFYSAAPARIDFVKEDEKSGGATNFITAKQSSLEFCDYLHLEQNSSVVDVGDKVSFGQHLADVGDTGAAVGAHHLHLAVTNLGESNKSAGGKFVTIPAPLSNYEVSDDSGASWRRVIRGVPSNGQWIRLPAPGPVRYTAVWRPSTEGEIQVYGWEYEDLRGRYDVLWHYRWRLAAISPFVI